MTVCRVIDWAIQAFGGAGVSDDCGLAAAYPMARYCETLTAPDEVHRNQLARLELRRYRDANPHWTGGNAEVEGVEQARRAGKAADFEQASHLPALWSIQVGRAELTLSI